MPLHSKGSQQRRGGRVFCQRWYVCVLIQTCHEGDQDPLLGKNWPGHRNREETDDVRALELYWGPALQGRVYEQAWKSVQQHRGSQSKFQEPGIDGKKPVSQQLERIKFGEGSSDEDE